MTQQGLLHEVAVIVDQAVGQRVHRVRDRQRMRLGDDPVGERGGVLWKRGPTSPPDQKVRVPKHSAAFTRALASERSMRSNSESIAGSDGHRSEAGRLRSAAELSTLCSTGARRRLAVSSRRTASSTSGSASGVTSAAASSDTTSSSRSSSSASIVLYYPNTRVGAIKSLSNMTILPSGDRARTRQREHDHDTDSSSARLCVTKSNHSGWCRYGRCFRRPTGELAAADPLTKEGRFSRPRRARLCSRSCRPRQPMPRPRHRSRACRAGPSRRASRSATAVAGPKRSRLPSLLATRCSSRGTSNSAARCGAVSSSARRGTTCFLSRSTASIPAPSRCATPPTSWHDMVQRLDARRQGRGARRDAPRRRSNDRDRGNGSRLPLTGPAARGTTASSRQAVVSRVGVLLVLPTSLVAVVTAAAGIEATSLFAGIVTRAVESYSNRGG